LQFTAWRCTRLPYPNCNNQHGVLYESAFAGRHSQRKRSQSIDKPPTGQQTQIGSETCDARSDSRLNAYCIDGVTYCDQHSNLWQSLTFKHRLAVYLSDRGEESAQFQR
jgi:hypothetical protein